MRDPKRITPIIERLHKVWSANPDLRLGQLVANGAKFGLNSPAHLPEDEPLIAAIEFAHTTPVQVVRCRPCGSMSWRVTATGLACRDCGSLIERKQECPSTESP